jgi:hypothetical protein
MMACVRHMTRHALVYEHAHLTVSICGISVKKEISPSSSPGPRMRRGPAYSTVPPPAPAAAAAATAAAPGVPAAAAAAAAATAAAADAGARLPPFATESASKSPRKESMGSKAEDRESGASPPQSNALEVGSRGEL